MGIYVFSRDVLLDSIEQDGATDFGKQIIPHALDRYRVHAHLFRGYWADVGTVRAFYDANLMLTSAQARLHLLRSADGRFTRIRGFFRVRGSATARCATAIINEGCHIDRATIEQSIVGIRTSIQSGATISRSVLLGADFYETDDDATARGDNPRLGVGRDVVLDRVIVDKNARIGDGARLVNEGGLEHADGDGYYIRDGVIVVPKDGVIKPGTVV